MLWPAKKYPLSRNFAPFSTQNERHQPRITAILPFCLLTIVKRSKPFSQNNARLIAQHFPSLIILISTTTPAAAAPCDDRWGPPVMGNPAVPTSHPDNKKAALWGATDDEAQNFHHPYLQYSPVEKSSSSRTESVLKVFNSWGSKAETTAQNIWHNLRTNSSVPGAAWGKMNLTTKALTGGGFETLYKQTFTGTNPNEKLKKTFACYLSTTTGPVAGTLYVSDAHAAFCSDRPLSFTAPSGQGAWSYYKVMIPLSKIGTINPVVMRENQSERYIQIVTIDGLDFWFTGFVNFEKASRQLSESISSFVGSIAAKPMVM